MSFLTLLSGAIALLLFFNSSVSYAKESTDQTSQGHTFEPSSWKGDKARIAGLRQENLNKEEDCNIRWKILWGHAKQGNLEARATLSMLAFPVWPFSPQIVIPGRSGDIISSFRDTVILAIHSNGYQFSEEKEQKKYVAHLNVLYSDLLKVFPQGQGYLSCIESQDDVSSCGNSASSYVGGAFKQKFIPSFEEYAKEIDFFLQSNVKPVCLYFKVDEDWRNTKQEFVSPAFKVKQNKK